MALTDINFQESDGMAFSVEIPLGSLNAPLDILIESSSNRYPVLEAPLIIGGGGGGNIFIMSE